jgi:hypothetical protein
MSEALLTGAHRNREPDIGRWEVDVGKPKRKAAPAAAVPPVAPPQPPPRGERHQLGAIFDDDDLVDRIFEYVCAEFPEIAQTARLAALKASVRRDYGGAKHYLRKPDERASVLQEVLRLFDGRNASEVARRLGIGRATVYRWLKQSGRG